ncbi:transcriptional regulator PtsJ [Tepidiphilus baoligensis]|uniref:Transcriptional regulator PtsJ n=1 Tax=Tepidiphilus baoligensis TaxID=2698687 RepID=A0ABX1QKG8_9PROT|nr:transcriptional regulator PtsJ [Tepidiphilus baoligensis]NMH15881.1 transcriptional regulator PtsJ [Tepidiphilus baoligensis]
MQITGNSASDIFESIRREVFSGRLGGGQPLPPVRELAKRLGVNRNTVAAAYKRLVAAGIAETMGRKGTVIKPPARLGEQEGTSANSPLVDLAGGNPDPALLPDPLQVLSSSGYRPTLYGHPVLYPDLEHLARRWFGSDCRDHDVLSLTHGAVDAIERLLTAYLVPGDKVAVEDPCFLGSLNTLRCAGLEAIPVAIDGQGMQPESLEEALAAGAQAVLCTPRAQNPSGCSLSKARASKLRRILENHPHVLVIEDDHFALLANTAYHSIVPESASHWALIRSVSKGFGPDLRLAFVASDATTAARLGMRLAPGTSWVSHLLQAAVRGLLGSDAIRAHLQTARSIYALRRETLIEALHTEGFAPQQPCDGFNVWVPLPQGTDAVRVAHSLAQKGWYVRTGEAFAIASKRPALRITASMLEPAQALRFAVQLRKCLEGASSGSCP